MQIHISEKFNARAMSTLLGYVGETNARAIEVKHPVVEGADTFRLRFEYSDGVVYDVPIIDGKVMVTGSLLREVGKVACQWLATKTNGETYDMVAKSQIFTLKIEQSIGDDIAPVPTYEQSLDMLDELNKGISSKITEPETEGEAGQILATNGDGTTYWTTNQGGGSYDDTEVRQLIADNNNEITDLKDYKADRKDLPTKTSQLTNDSNFVADEDYIHTDNNYTNADKDKLAGLSNYDDTEVKRLIESNTQNISSLNATKAGKDELPIKLSALENDTDFVDDSNYVHTDNNYTDEDKQKLSSLENYDDSIVKAYIKSNADNIADLDSNKADKSNLPTKTSQLTNDTNFVSDSDYVHTDNNFTDAEKLKLSELENYDDEQVKADINAYIDERIGTLNTALEARLNGGADNG